MDQMQEELNEKDKLIEQYKELIDIINQEKELTVQENQRLNEQIVILISYILELNQYKYVIYIKYYY